MISDLDYLLSLLGLTFMPQQWLEILCPLFCLERKVLREGKIFMGRGYSLIHGEVDDCGAITSIQVHVTLY